MANVQFQKPFAEFSGPMEAKLTGLRINMELGSVASASISHVNNEGARVIKMGSAEAIARSAALQNLRFTVREKPDVSITADDELYGTMEFTGFLSTPGLDGSRTTFNEQASVVGDDAILNTLDFSIYEPELFGESEEAATVVGNVPLPSDGKITAYLAAVSKTLYENFSITVEKTTNEQMRALKVQQHTLNGPGYRQWLAVLENSDVEFETWGEVLGKYPAVQEALAIRVVAMLKNKTSGFWPVMNSLTSEFKMVYVPAYNGPGKLISILDRAQAGNARSLKVSSDKVFFSDGSGNLLPLGGVTVTAAPAAENEREETAQSSETVAAFWPKPMVPGYIHQMAPPSWLTNVKGQLLVTAGEASKGGDSRSGTKDYTLSKAEAQATTRTTLKESLDKVRGTKILEEFARVEYEDLILGATSCAVETPLNYSLIIGERVTVEISDGAGFEGFVSGLSHNFSLQNGSQVDAYSRITFTHVKYGA